MHLHNVSGGVLSGDKLAVEIAALAESRVQITTTGATRLYRRRSGGAESEQSVSIKVGDGAIVEYLPDPVIPFAGLAACSKNLRVDGQRLDAVLVGNHRSGTAGRWRAFRVR